MHKALEQLKPDLRDFDASRYPLDLQGWGSDAPIFAQLIEQVRPRIIFEVGTWKGASAIHMANVCALEGLDTAIVCIDTWLGAYEFIGDASAERDLMRWAGYPQVYYQFLANIIHTDTADRIIPFPQTSLIAARWLWQQGVKADLIYIDGSHDMLDVREDIAYYQPLLRSGGVLFGDDYDCWESVRAALDGCGHAYDVRDGRHWVLR